MGWPQQVKKRLKPFEARQSLRLGATVMAALLLGAAPPGIARAAEAYPNAREVLKLVRANESNQNQRFTGRLQTSSSAGKINVPFRLTMRGGTITYQFVDNPPETLTLRMGENGSRLDRAVGSGRAQVVSGAKLDDLVRGTDITYEDFAMKFLYWNNAKVVGDETVMTRRCWIVQAVPSNRGDSQYDMVRLWVEKTGGLLRAECYSGGKLAKRFEVRAVQRAPGGGYVLKTMKIQRLDATGRDRAPTSLFLSPS